MGIGGSSDASAKAIGGMGRLREDMLLYRLVDMHGGGELVLWMRYAVRTGDYSFVDGLLDTKVREFMYNQGKGKLVTITELVKMRNKERNAMLGAFSRKKGKGKSGPNVLDEFNQEGDNVGDLKKALKLLDGGGGKSNESKYREIAWKLNERGSMGETLVGVCLLNGSDIHRRLVFKLIEMFPKLINDINVSEDYYGLSPLHQAIVNQDVHLVSVLLKRGADVDQRCFGAYFCADDQKGERTDSLEHEAVDLYKDRTNYTGNMYFGEYPLSFAACMNHPDCYRLLLAYKARPNAQDTNGNTALHMCVIHENLDMLRLAVEKGASTHILNEQKLTPLTLAAKLAKKRMYLELLEMEAEAIWDYGVSYKGSYPLGQIDTINEENGDVNETSALSLVVYGSTAEHLQMLDGGLLENILQAKWDSFAKFEWMKSLAVFIMYFLLLTGAYMNRPFSLTTELETQGSIDGTTDVVVESTDPAVYNVTYLRCHLNAYSTLPWTQGWFRLGCEAGVILGIFGYILVDIRDIRRIGRIKWINIIKAFPAKIIFKASGGFILTSVLMRGLCRFNTIFIDIDNYMCAYAVVLTSVHFLFYCRAIKFVGPFVLMIYSIIATDLRRFILIYTVFLMGFSQAFYMIFYSCESSIAKEHASGTKWENIMSSPQESVIRTFIMTIGEFVLFYRRLEECPVRYIVFIGKGVFLFFELCVSILQLNLLIAMMTRTYESISRSTVEYKRQWAKVILMLEVGLPPRDRLKYLYQYTIPTGTDKLRRSFVMTKKIDKSNLLDHEREKKENMEKEASEQRKMIMRRKKMEQELAERRSLRPRSTLPPLVNKRLSFNDPIPSIYFRPANRPATAYYLRRSDSGESDRFSPSSDSSREQNKNMKKE